MNVLDLSRWQFAITTIYHFFLVPLTLGLSFMLAIMESAYVMTGREIWRDTTKFCKCVAFVTGHRDIPMSVRAIKAGASDFLTKPVRAQALVVAIHAAIEEYRAERGALADNEALRRRFASPNRPPRMRPMTNPTGIA